MVRGICGIRPPTLLVFAARAAAGAPISTALVESDANPDVHALPITSAGILQNDLDMFALASKWVIRCERRPLGR